MLPEQRRLLRIVVRVSEFLEIVGWLFFAGVLFSFACWALERLR